MTSYRNFARTNVPSRSCHLDGTFVWAFFGEPFAGQKKKPRSNKAEARRQAELFAPWP